MGVVSWAQDSDKKNVKLTVLNQKERPMKNVKVSVYNNSQSGKTDKSGQFDFKYLTSKDSIKVILPTVGETVISVDGLDAIVLKRLSANSYTYTDKNAKSITVEGGAKKNAGILDVPAILAKRQASSLIELLKGHMPGLYIDPQNIATVRGAGSFNVATNPDQTYEVVVFVDGTIVGTVKDANIFLNVNDIQTIELNKSGSGYGMQGANGVLVVTTKRGGLSKT
jgi:TonB-dependent Receptor Plug Domain.